MSELSTDQACAVIDDGIAEIKRLRADLAKAKRLLRELLDDITTPAEEWAQGTSVYRARAFLRANDGGA